MVVSWLHGISWLYGMCHSAGDSDECRNRLQLPCMYQHCPDAWACTERWSWGTMGLLGVSALQAVLKLGCTHAVPSKLCSRSCLGQHFSLLSRVQAQDSCLFLHVYARAERLACAFWLWGREQVGHECHQQHCGHRTTDTQTNCLRSQSKFQPAGQHSCCILCPTSTPGGNSLCPTSTPGGNSQSW